MHNHAKDWFKVDDAVVMTDTMETLNHIGHVLVLKHGQDEGENGEHTDSSEHCCFKTGASTLLAPGKL